MPKDYGMQFERLLNECFDAQGVTFANYWSNDVARNSLFYTLCVIESGKADETDRGVMNEFMSQLDRGSLDRYEALIFFNHLKGLD